MSSQCWNLFIYRVPSQPSTQRVYVWRKLKSWGGLYLQQSTCVLPQRDDFQQQLEKLKQEILAGSGEADLLTVSLEDAEQNQMLIQRFQQQSEEEYHEFLGRCQAFHQELAKEREQNNLTFAELDENERELAKLHSWLTKIFDRDFFQAPNHALAINLLEQCEQDFKKFSQEIYAAQNL